MSNNQILAAFMLTECADCGTACPTDEHSNSDGEHICSSCAENYVICSYSAFTVKRDDAIWVESSDSWYKASLEGNAFYISHVSGEPIESGSQWTHYNAETDNNEHYTFTERDDEFVCCYHSGEWVRIDNAIEYNGELFHPNALAGYRNIIRSYSHKPDPIFNKMAWENTTYFGIELEVTASDPKYSSVGVAAMSVKDSLGDNFYLKDDSSIEGNGGFEIVSHPMTWQYFKSNYKWKELFQGFRDAGCDTHSSCGMHIHVSKQALKPLGWWKVTEFMSKCSKNVVKFSRREEYGLNRWARMPNSASISQLKTRRMDFNEDAITSKDLVRYTSRMPSFNAQRSRYNALNHEQGGATMEFRLFDTTVDSEEFVNTVAFVSALVDYVRVTGYVFIKRNSSHNVWKDFMDFLVKSNRYHALNAYLNKVNIK